MIARSNRIIAAGLSQLLRDARPPTRLIRNNYGREGSGAQHDPQTMQIFTSYRLTHAAQREHRWAGEQLTTLVSSSEKSKPPGDRQQHRPPEERGHRGHLEQQPSPNISSFDEQEAAMRAASAARWAEDERFGLKNAFGLQLERLEVKYEAKWEHISTCSPLPKRVCGKDTRA